MFYRLKVQIYITLFHKTAFLEINVLLILLFKVAGPSKRYFIRLKNELV